MTSATRMVKFISTCLKICQSWLHFSMLIWQGINILAWKVFPFSILRITLAAHIVNYRKLLLASLSVLCSNLPFPLAVLQSHCYIMKNESVLVTIRVQLWSKDSHFRLCIVISKLFLTSIPILPHSFYQQCFSDRLILFSSPSALCRLLWRQLLLMKMALLLA